MFNQGEFLYLEAKIQSRLAEFLMCKERLSRLVLYPKTESKARVLLAVQSKLEEQLSEVLSKLESLKSGKLSSGDISAIGVFYYTMERHIKDVDNLEREVKGEAPPMPKWVFPLLISGGVLLIVLLGLRR